MSCCSGPCRDLSSRECGDVYASMTSRSAIHCSRVYFASRTASRAQAYVMKDREANVFKVEIAMTPAGNLFPRLHRLLGRLCTRMSLVWGRALGPLTHCGPRNTATMPMRCRIVVEGEFLVRSRDMHVDVVVEGTVVECLVKCHEFPRAWVTNRWEMSTIQNTMVKRCTVMKT